MITTRISQTVIFQPNAEMCAGTVQVQSVDSNGKAAIRNVEVGSQYEKQWFVNKGLNAGDIVIVEGVMKLTEGAAVKTT